MKNIALLLIFLVFASLNIYAQTQKKQNKNVNPLIGKWETPDRPEQKTKVTIDIKPGGKIQYSISVPLAGNFIAIGNRLISMFKNPQTGGTEVDTSIIVIKGDTLLQKSYSGGSENVIRSTRIHEGKEGPGIIGSWISDNFNGHRARQQFTTFNSILVDIILKTIKGTYYIKGNQFTINSFNTAPLNIKYSITNDVLSIQNEGTNKQLKLIRILK